MPGKTRIDIADTKLKILQIMTKYPDANQKDIKRVLKHEYRIYADGRTIQKYMEEMGLMLNRIKLEVESRIKDKVEHGDSLWQQITKMLK